MIKFFRWLGAIFMVFVWLLGKIILNEMEGMGKFGAEVLPWNVFLIYGGWMVFCVVLFLWIKPKSDKTAEGTLKVKRKRIDRQGERRTNERRKYNNRQE